MSAPVHAGRVCALILAGGRSSRMGSDKASLPFRGDTLLAHAVSFWKSVPAIESVIVSVGAEDHLDSLPDGVIAVPDLFPGCGPMAGLHAAFALTDAQLLYVSAVDMPFLQAGALLSPPEGDAAVYVLGDRPEPLFGVYRRTAFPAIEASLRAGERKMQVLLDRIDTEYIPLPEDLVPVISNLNTRPDFFRALAGTPPLVLFVGWSGAGKTTFLEKLLPCLAVRGLRTAVIKHDAHGFTTDSPGKDTWRLAQAGATCTAISGPNGWAVLSGEQIALGELREKLPDADIIICEGFKTEDFPKIEIHRRAAGKPFLPRDGTFLAVVTDEPADAGIPQFGIEDAEACAELIMDTFFA